MGDTANFSGHEKIVHDFACLLEGYMQATLDDALHNFEIDCMNTMQPSCRIFGWPDFWARSVTEKSKLKTGLFYNGIVYPVHILVPGASC